MTVARALGLMSGTSMDGVDAALLETDGLRPLSFCPTLFAPYRDEDRALLRAALAQAIDLDDRTARPGPLADAERMVTDRHAEAVETFLRENGIDAATVDVIGFHGQTVLHRPERRLTVQIGDGAALARRLGIDVVYDMRAADVAAGGQGAPLVPVYHRALVAASGLEGSVAVLNIGGVANLTFVEGEAEPIACDTGPGNALIDDLMLARTGVPLDRDGAAAAAGHVDEAALAQLLDHRYFEAPPPKSLDRNDFSLAPVEGLATFDAAATHGLHRRLDREMFFAAAGAAAPRHRLRRRRAQSGADARARRAPSLRCAERRAIRLVRRGDRGTGLRLSRRSLSERPAAHLSDHDGSALASAGRQAGARGLTTSRDFAAKLRIQQRERRHEL